MLPKKITPGTCECDLIWKQGLCRHNQVKIRSYWSRVAHNPVTGVFIREKRGRFAHRDTDADRQTDTHTHRRMPCKDGGRDWSDESPSLGMPRTASTPEPGRRKTDSHSEPLEGTYPPTL